MFIWSQHNSKSNTPSLTSPNCDIKPTFSPVSILQPGDCKPTLFVSFSYFPNFDFISEQSWVSFKLKQEVLKVLD